MWRSRELVALQSSLTSGLCPFHLQFERNERLRAIPADQASGEYHLTFRLCGVTPAAEGHRHLLRAGLAEMARSVHCAWTESDTKFFFFFYTWVARDVTL